MSYAEMMKIKPESLDQEWLEQASRYMELVEHAVDARINFEQLKDRAETVRAEIDRAVRLNPAQYGVDKVTEGAVNAAIQLSKQYTDIQVEVVDARRIHLLTQGACDAMEHRKKALEALTQLTLAGWRGEPKPAERPAAPSSAPAHGTVRRRRN